MRRTDLSLYDGGNRDVSCFSNPRDLRIAKIPKMCLGGDSKPELSFLLWGCGPSTKCWNIQKTPTKPHWAYPKWARRHCLYRTASEHNTLNSGRGELGSGCGEDRGAAGWRGGCWGGDIIKPSPVSLLHQSKCVNSVQDEGLPCAPKSRQDTLFYPSLRPWAETQGWGVQTISPSSYSPEKTGVPAFSWLLRPHTWVHMKSSLSGLWGPRQYMWNKARRRQRKGLKGTHKLLSSCYRCV